MGKTPLKYVAVEGVIGVGKTELCRRLAKALKARLVLEKASENPFLPDFYRDQKRFAFLTQLHFFVSRRMQLEQALKGRGCFVSDFNGHKDRLFAGVNLDGEELKLFQRLEETAAPPVVPDLTIFLRADVKTLLKRIRQRAVSYEQTITAEYLKRLDKAYENYFRRYTAGPLLIVDAAKVDLTDKTVFGSLLRVIKNRPSGKVLFP